MSGFTSDTLSAVRWRGIFGSRYFRWAHTDVSLAWIPGNPIPNGFISEACYNLIYLEIAACRLTTLPQALAKMIPNVRVLNLNYNFLEDTRPLEGLTRLRKLTIIGSRIKATKQLVRVLRGMQDIEMLDFRYVRPFPIAFSLCLLCRFVVGSYPTPLENCGVELWNGWLPFRLSPFFSIHITTQATCAPRERL